MINLVNYNNNWYMSYGQYFILAKIILLTFKPYGL